MIIAFYKPFGVQSQFTREISTHITLANFGFPPEVYPLGRLDADSEGLLLLSDERSMNHFLLHPNNEHPREYWVQVEGTPTADALKKLAAGVIIRRYQTKPCTVRLLDETEYTRLPERTPPVRFRKSVPTTWIALELKEGKNRQVRQMTAAIGAPTLRLVRVRIGNLRIFSLLSPLQSGFWRQLTYSERQKLGVIRKL